MVNLIIKNNIKKFIKEIGKEEFISSIGFEFADELQKKIEDLINKAIERAMANHRRTLYGRDL